MANRFYNNVGMFLGLLIFSNNFIYAEQLNLDNTTIQVAENLEPVGVLYEDGVFCVVEKNKIYPVKEYLVDPVLRNISIEDLKKILDSKTVMVAKSDSGDFLINITSNLRGGGPISGMIAYWVTKTLCYGTAVAATGTAIVATGGVAGAAMGGIIAAGTVGAPVGATIVGGVLAGGGLAVESAVVTTSVLSVAGGIGGAIAVVESTSTGIGLFFAAIPFLP